MFNRGTFNRQRFNLQEKSTEVALCDTLTDAVEARGVLTGDYHLMAATSEQTKAGLTVACVVSESIGASEAFSVGFSLYANYDICQTDSTDIAIVDVLSAETALTQDCYITNTADARFAASADISGDLHLDSGFTGALDFDGIIISDYEAAAIDCYVSLYCFVESAIFDTLYLTVDVTIPAGGKLVIDSDNFTCLLGKLETTEDGETEYVYENVLDKHDGEWINLDRLVEQIYFNTGTGSEWPVTMVYTERWL